MQHKVFHFLIKSFTAAGSDRHVGRLISDVSIRKINGLNNTSLREPWDARGSGEGGLENSKIRESTYLHKSIAHLHVTKETGT